jgi:hypothetical protein
VAKDSLWPRSPPPWRPSPTGYRTSPWPTATTAATRRHFTSTAWLDSTFAPPDPGEHCRGR